MAQHSGVNALFDKLRETITRDGPMPVADYMRLCLTDPDHGYYTTQRPVGGRASAAREGGDFITAPEISQMFGEMLGVWCMEVWQALGQPSPFALVELGPGRGTLMADLLRVAQALPGFAAAAQVHLVEISGTLAEQQSLTLGKSGITPIWLRDISALPDMPMIVIGNEFLDALPFDQWVKRGDDWVQRAVTLDGDSLAFTTTDTVLPVAEAPLSPDEDGAIFETAPEREALVTELSKHLQRTTGAALFLDYGHIRSGVGDTFQAVRDHAFADPLHHPGRADLTSHVDFEPLLAAARAAGCAVPPATTQGDFLMELGLLERAGNLGHGRDARVQASLQSAVERLAKPEQMGQLFKALAFGAPASLGERWPGFALAAERDDPLSQFRRGR